MVLKRGVRKHMSKQMKPDFLGLSKIEEQLLINKLDAIRLAIEHAGEKGRSLEAETISF